MKLLIIGAAGDVGSAVCRELQERHELIKVGRNCGEYQMDLYNRSSVQKMYEKNADIDGVVCAAGVVKFRPLIEHTSASMLFGLQRKVMGQINLVLQGLNYIKDNGTFTLTSGISDTTPVHKGVAASTANSALAGFVRGAALEMPRGLRINVVSPGLLDVSNAQFGAMFPEYQPVCSKRVGLAYAKSVEGGLTG